MFWPKRLSTKDFGTHAYINNDQAMRQVDLVRQPILIYKAIIYKVYTKI